MSRASDGIVMVAGGSGFLGSHLCDQLIAAGHDVLCVDNYYTGTSGTSVICSAIASNSCATT